MPAVEPRSGPAPALPLAWPAAAFALLAGLSLAYVPSAFQADAWGPASHGVRLVGAGLLASSAALFAALLHAGAPRWLDVAGRGLLGASLLAAPLLAAPGLARGGVQGAAAMALCALLGAGALLEGVRAVRARGLLRPVLAAGLLLGAGALLLPSAGLAPAEPAAPQAWPRLLALCGVLAAAGLLVPAGERRLGRQGVFALAGVCLAVLGAALGWAGAWGAGAAALALAAAGLGTAAGARPGPPRTVRGKLLRGLAFAALLPLLALGAGAVALAQGSVEREVREESLLAARGEAARMEGLLAGAWEALRLVRDTPGFVEAAQAGDPARLTAFLHVLPERAPAFEAAFVVDLDGRGVADCSPSDAIRKGRFERREYFQGVLQTGAEYVSRPFLSIKGRPVVALASPLRVGGEQVGVLVGLLSLERLTRETSDTVRGFRVRAVDQRGLALLRDTADGARLLSAAALPPALAAAVSRGEATHPATFEAGGALAEGPALTTALPVQGTPWTVLVSRDARAAYREVTRLSATLIALVGLAVLAVLGLSQLVARDLIRRLEALHGATAALARGELGRRVDVTEEDELGALGHGFNRMAARLEEGQGALARSNAELTEAVRLREEFLSVAGHELRTPLTPLKGFVALTLQRLEAQGHFPERERTLKALRSMSRQTERLSRLVGELLDITRLRAGRFELERAPVDLAAAAGEVLERFELAHAPHVRFTLQAPPLPVVGLWDEARLEQVLTNLLSNAARYSPEGGRVQVELEVVGGSAVLRVRDEGIGIPAESLPTLFQPFARASNATSRHFGGLGLGLFICREIVERHGGRIWAESAGPRQGSCFHVALPLSEAAAAPANAPAHAA
jgi:signal transduction histidine kinase